MAARAARARGAAAPAARLRQSRRQRLRGAAAARRVSAPPATCARRRGSVARRGDVARFPVLVARDAISRGDSRRARRAAGHRHRRGPVGRAAGRARAPAQWRELARSGTSHLMAISGMHIGMFALVAGWLTARVQRLRQRRGALGTARDAAVVAGSLAALGYASLAGWSVPTQRTAIMIAIVALALRCATPRRVRRRAGGRLRSPCWRSSRWRRCSVGFWLSFGAVAAILLVTSGQLARPGMARGYAQSQWAVTAGLVPVLVGSFGTVSLVSVGVNFLAIPLYTLVIVPAVLLATALCCSPRPGRVPLALGGVAWLIEATWPLIAVPAAWPWATWGVAGLGALGWAMLVAGAVAALAPVAGAGAGGGAAARGRRLRLARAGARVGRRTLRHARRGAGARRGRRDAPPRAGVRRGAVVPQRQRHGRPRGRALPASPRPAPRRCCWWSATTTSTMPAASLPWRD